MNYKGNNFYIDNIGVSNLVKNHETPIYAYSLNKLKKNINIFKKNFKNINPLICFSVKSNSNIKILSQIKKFGLGADVVSIGELISALKAGINEKKIVFSGVGKTNQELEFAIKKKILLINSESEEELIEIEKIAKKRKVVVDVGVRLNPDIDALTINKISTGKKDNKFGISAFEILGILLRFKKSKYINIKCLSVHIGSQITRISPYKKVLSVISKLLKRANYKSDLLFQQLQKSKVYERF